MKARNNNTDTRSFMRQFYRGNILNFILAFLEAVLGVALSLIVSWMIQQILDIAAGYDTGRTLTDILYIFVAMLLSMLAVGMIVYRAKPRFVTKGMAQYKEYVFSELTKKNISAFAGENTSLYISALSNDAVAVEKGYLLNMFEIAEKGLTCIGALIMMFLYSPLLTVISIGLSMLPVISAVLVGNRMASAEKEVSDTNESYMATIKDALTGFSVIKSFKAELQICRIFAENVRRLSVAKTRKMRIEIVISLLASVSGLVAQIGIFMVSAYLALSGKGITAGTVIVFVQLMNYILSPISVLPKCFAEYNGARALIAKLASALSQNVREENSDVFEGPIKSISLHGVSFGYSPEKQILHNINLTFECGKSYAVVGASGSGKSTLLNLLMGGYGNYDGSIMLDDNELRSISSGNLYDIISIIQQNVFVFNASVRDNITMFGSFPENEVERAVELSGLSELVKNKGSDYMCGENGSGLSGGEKQRISIARSLLKKSRVLLVDEATAALDAKTAYNVSNSILDLDGITRIVVTHSLEETLLKRYDCILTLKNGVVTECGSFDELIDRKGYFYSLFTVSQ